MDRSIYSPDHGAEQRIKRRRGNLPKQVTDLLKEWFRAHKNHPYPSEDEKQMLMCQTGLTITQVSCPDDVIWWLRPISRLTLSFPS